MSSQVDKMGATAMNQREGEETREVIKLQPKEDNLYNRGGSRMKYKGRPNLSQLQCIPSPRVIQGRRRRISWIQRRTSVG